MKARTDLKGLPTEWTYTVNLKFSKLALLHTLIRALSLPLSNFEFVFLTELSFPTHRTVYRILFANVFFSYMLLLLGLCQDFLFF